MCLGVGLGMCNVFIITPLLGRLLRHSSGFKPGVSKAYGGPMSIDMSVYMGTHAV